jgi:hypothetical protein
MSANLSRSVAHYAQAGSNLQFVRGDAHAVVGDAKGNVMPPHLQTNTNPGGLSMFKCIGNRFLRDAV